MFEKLGAQATEHDCVLSHFIVIKGIVFLLKRKDVDQPRSHSLSVEELGIKGAHRLERYSSGRVLAWQA